MTQAAANFSSDLFQVADDLLEVMRQETEALKARRVAAVTELGEIKNHLTSAFAQRLWKLKENMGLAGQIDAPTRARLRATTDALRKAARDNALVLLAARDANQRLLDVVVQTAAKRQTPEQYGRYGRLAMQTPGGARAVSLFQDQRL